MKIISLLFASFLTLGFSALCLAEESGEFQVWSSPGESGVCAREKVSELTEDVVGEMIKSFELCDPVKNLFDAGGAIRRTDERDYGPAKIELWNLQVLSYTFRDVLRAFEALPVMARRKLVEELGTKAADLIVSYSDQKQLERWLLDLEWERDIEHVDQSLYTSTPWGEDWTQKVKVSDSALTKTDLWIRMMWFRRGEWLFTKAKTLIQSSLERQKKDNGA